MLTWRKGDEGGTKEMIKEVLSYKDGQILGDGDRGNRSDSSRE